ncbi:hypothetical protein GGTG_00323 [Gaeumannomyces tritici R3-111a-1]|uniref:Uncharacterized protein n=1 Tax=Gaeumannomyces tritici (strain R3-111a-1) TaxID=644352 RepID=J3NGD2_GAET3|nr:hypothetical protein GGTG_00323 [Gaeumannomyces tritici R3-111a-1]EJT80322.1 hypothetical protein GGTG_00323 [Gaeumannomyces tritici R3-111a-1]
MQVGATLRAREAGPSRASPLERVRRRFCRSKPNGRHDRRWRGGELPDWPGRLAGGGESRRGSTGVRANQMSRAPENCDGGVTGRDDWGALAAAPLIDGQSSRRRTKSRALTAPAGCGRLSNHGTPPPTYPALPPSPTSRERSQGQS